MSRLPRALLTTPHPAVRWLTVLTMQVLIAVAMLVLFKQFSAEVDSRSKARSEQKLVELERQCDRTNLQRGWDQLRAEEVSPQRERQARRLFPILDCHETVFEHDGRQVPLPESEWARYVRIERAGRVPVVTRLGAVH